LIAILFAVVAILLPIQFWFAKTNSRGEPYPALLMPAFDGTSSDARGLASGRSVTVTVTFDDGTVEPLPLRRLFARAPSSHILALAEIGLKPKPSPPVGYARSPGSFRELLKQHVLPGLSLANARRYYWSGPEPETVDWLRARVGELFPGRPARGVRVEWRVDTFVWETSRWKRRHTPSLSLDIPL
jgi:hypothetical protein